MKLRLKESKVMRTESELELRGSDIIALLRAAGRDVPDDATVTFCVPGGCEWSFTDIAVDADAPIKVCWTATAREDADDEWDEDEPGDDENGGWRTTEEEDEDAAARDAHGGFKL